jgi:putative membrane protein
MLSEADHKRISAAIEAAEAKTSGEIFCVFAHEVSRYREVPLAWGAIAAFVIPPLLVLSGLHRFAMAAFFWTDESVNAVEALVLHTVSAYALVQAGLFVAVALIVSLPPVRRRLTPAALKRHRVRQVARHHFAAAGARLSHAEPHILIFASQADRKVELVAHAAIHKAVGDKPWNDAVAAVAGGMKAHNPAEGFVRAIGICGAALAEHFPSDGPARNQLPNTLLET